MAHRGYYRIRAEKHMKASREAKSASDREAHREVASGYYKLSRGSYSQGFSAYGHHVKPHHKSKHRHHAKGRRRDSRGRFLKRR